MGQYPFYTIDKIDDPNKAEEDKAELKPEDRSKPYSFIPASTVIVDEYKFRNKHGHMDNGYSVQTVRRTPDGSLIFGEEQRYDKFTDVYVYLEGIDGRPRVIEG
jgi:hypothetical protein